MFVIKKKIKSESQGQFNLPFQFVNNHLILIKKKRYT